jgi:hypothetical protein
MRSSYFLAVILGYALGLNPWPVMGGQGFSAGEFGRR